MEAGGGVFTGLVEGTGVLRALDRTGRGADLAVETPFAAASLALGDSVAVSGVCLTVVAQAPGPEPGSSAFTANVVEETVRRTTLGGLAPGDRVNLERAVRLGDRLGGHLVAGHVDGVGVVAARREAAHGVAVDVELPEELVRYAAPKGSIALDGASLTIGEVHGRAMTVYLIPQTLAVTVAGAYRRGTRVNVEVDLISRYVESLLPAARAAREQA